MKILIVSQRFYPEPFRITDIAKELAQKGNDVTILCGLPMYPKGFIYPNYRKKKSRIENYDNLKIVRCNEIERRTSFLRRVINYYSFPFFGNKMIKKMDTDFDVILINELSPILCAIPGLKYAKKHNKKVLMYEMDLWPESLMAGGIKKDSIVYKHYKKVSAKIYSRCNKILVSTKEHKDYIRNLPNCSSVEIDYLPQYAEEQFWNISTRTLSNDKKINLMFAGNIGRAQSISTIINAANILKNDGRFIFHIVGDGIECANAKKLVENYELKNVIFYGQIPLENMASFYDMADIMLVTLENKSYANMTIPGKVQSYIAAGKPIIGAVNGATKNLIIENNIGQCCDSEDYVAMANIIKNLDINAFNEYSLNAKKIYKKEFCREKFMEKLILELERMK